MQGNGSIYNGRTVQEIEALVRAGWLRGDTAESMAADLGLPQGFIGMCVHDFKLPVRDHMRRVIDGTVAGDVSAKLSRTHRKGH